MAECKPTCLYEGFLQLRNNSNEMGTLVGFFRQHDTETGFQSATSLISIGAGDGVLDSTLMSKALPNLKSYMGIECDPNNFRHLQDNLDNSKEILKNMEGSKVSVELFEADVGDFAGPATPVDVVMIMHAMYYFKDRRSEIIVQSMNWLKSSGRLIIGVVGEGNFLQKLANIGKDDFPSWPSKIGSHLESLGLTWAEYEVSHEFNSSKCDKRFADFVLQKSVSELEATNLLNYLQTLKEIDTDIIKHSTHLFVVQKK